MLVRLHPHAHAMSHLRVVSSSELESVPGRPTHMGKKVVNAMYVNVGNVHHSVEREEQTFRFLTTLPSGGGGRGANTPEKVAYTHPNLSD